MIKFSDWKTSPSTEVHSWVWLPDRRDVQMVEAFSSMNWKPFVIFKLVIKDVVWRFVERSDYLRLLPCNLLVPAQLWGTVVETRQSHIVSRVRVEQRAIWNTNRDVLIISTLNI